VTSCRGSCGCASWTKCSGIDLRADWIAWLGEYKTFLLEWGFLRADFDLETWVDWGPLRALQARGRARPSPELGVRPLLHRAHPDSGL
jgi:hypothetical protein